MWARNINLARGKLILAAAVSWVKSLRLGGYSDWRLPTKDELAAQVLRGGERPAEFFSDLGFFNVPTTRDSTWYWSSTDYGDSTTGALVVDLWNGNGSFSYKSVNYNLVWPVRTGKVQNKASANQSANEPTTATDNNFADNTRRDGYLIKNKDIVIDERKGLMWARNTNLSGKQMRWSDAMEWVKTVQIGGYNDWRLPTKDELTTQANRGGKWPAIYFIDLGFINIPTSRYNIHYWSSTSSTDNDRDENPWYANMFDGKVRSGYDNHAWLGGVWPVRSGK